MDPIERLKSWLKAASISQAEMARRCDYDRHNFNHLLKRRIGKPPLDLAVAIARETGGAIPVDAWSDARAA